MCNGCGMPTEDAYSSGHLVLSHFGTCICSNVETNPSRTCLVSGPLNFEHPSVLLFCFKCIVCSHYFVVSRRLNFTLSLLCPWFVTILVCRAEIIKIRNKRLASRFIVITHTKRINVDCIMHFLLTEGFGLILYDILLWTCSVMFWNVINSCNTLFGPFR